RDLVRQTAQDRGWRVEGETPALDRAADAAAAVLSMDVPELIPLLDVYAEAEVAAVMSMGEQADIVRGVVVGTVLGEELLSALRLLAQRSVTLKLLVPDAEDASEPGADAA